MAITADAVSGLARTVLATKYDKYKPTPDFHEDLWALYCSPYPKCAAAAPRGHAKTTGGTGAYLIAALCMRERRYAMIISGTEEQSVEFINEIKGQFIDNEPLRRMFDIEGLQKDTSTDIIVRFKDGGQIPHSWGRVQDRIPVDAYGWVLVLISSLGMTWRLRSRPILI